MLEILSCPICSNTELTEHYTCTDYTVSHETFHVKLCSNCTLGITTPQPAKIKIGNYYQSKEYISHSGTAPGLIGSAYRLARSFTRNWKSNVVTRSAEIGKGAILDFGCGTGEFLQTMQQKGWVISGVEPSEIARKKAEKLLGQPILPDYENLKSNNVDVITLWHVLEHVTNLKETILHLRTLLKNNGTIIIAVPNYQSPDATHYKNYWAGYDVPRHLWHFSKKSMELLLSQAGLKLASIVPMKLDAYYISLLSEKNKNSGTLSSYVNAVSNGVWSNHRAKKDINHSSLIYIAQPQ